ncbi:MAG TPA: diaminopimelate epimerase [Streptosporangiaceae bacterium]|jgi:diaminopimelate epimerase|nr:diaminopimelate epimerase [Streptosporangiaceae bacterium]
MRFAKGHGTGNDFVILVDPGDDQGLSADLAAQLCDRRVGIGADGVLRAVRTDALAGGAAPAAAGPESDPVAAPNGSAAGSPAGPVPEWYMDYRNSDGSLAEMCGNGIRVFARYLADAGLATRPAFTVATRSGFRRVRFEDDGSITAEMGAVTVFGPGRVVVGGPGGVTCEGLRISVGNPHLACLVDAPLAGFDLTRPPQLDPAQFPRGGNVELVRVTGPGVAEMRVRERGSGETRSCGTGAVAAAAAASAAAGQDHGSWQVSVPGGQLTVTLEPGAAWLGGPAVIVAEGELDDAWLAAATVGTRRPA